MISDLITTLNYMLHETQLTENCDKGSVVGVSKPEAKRYQNIVL